MILRTRTKTRIFTPQPKLRPRRKIEKAPTARPVKVVENARLSVVPASNPARVVTTPIADMAAARAGVVVVVAAVVVADISTIVDQPTARRVPRVVVANPNPTARPMTSARSIRMPNKRPRNAPFPVTTLFALPTPKRTRITVAMIRHIPPNMMIAARIMARVKNLFATKWRRRWVVNRARTGPVKHQSSAIPKTGAKTPALANRISVPLLIPHARLKVVENVAGTGTSAVVAVNKVAAASAGIAVLAAGPRPVAVAALAGSNPSPGFDLMCFSRPWIVQSVSTP